MMSRISVFKIFIIFGVVGAYILHNLENYSKPIFIESLESRSIDGKPVINAINYSSKDGIETWTMKQNHHDGKEWDDLKIIVNTNYEPATAEYFQYKNGVEQEFRVSCFTCHANGPRLIRPNFKSREAKLSLYERGVISYWNLKIKHSGNIETPQDVTLLDQFRKVPLKYEGRFDNKVIELESCNLCHGENSLMGRSAIEAQHQGTAKYLIESGEMPPLFFKISPEDKKFLAKNYSIIAPE